MSTNLASVWRWNFGIFLVFVGAALTYAIQFRDWKLAQMMSIFGVVLVIVGVILLTRTLTRNQQQEKNEQSAKWLIRLVWVAAFGMGVIVLYATQYEHWILERVASIASVALIAAGAAWLAGALLGFIFGLPHTREDALVQQQSSAGRDTHSSDSAPFPDRRKDDRYRRSTSLEEVSDWLTKMIVGVGLTQLNKIPGKLDDLATYIANGMLANGAGGGYTALHALEVNRAFALGICLYFAVDGFLFGYLWACVDLLELFRRQDSDVKNRLEKTETIAETADRKAETAADATYEVIKARDAYNEIVEKKKNNQPVDTNRAEEFIKKLREYSGVFPTNRSLHIVLANLCYETGKWDEAVAVLQQFIANRQRAGQTNDDDVATAWFNLACFYSTQSSKATDETARKQLLRRAEDSLVNCLETARKSGQSTLTIHLGRAKTDEDMEALRNAGVIDPLLARYATSQATSS